jgi:hypothetical protein
MDAVQGSIDSLPLGPLCSKQPIILFGARAFSA